MKVEFNINSDVSVKLTDLGRTLYVSHWKSFKLIPPALNETHGWSRWQLWELMAVFGSSLSNGGPLPFETTIVFETAIETK